MNNEWISVEYIKDKAIDEVRECLPMFGGAFDVDFGEIFNDEIEWGSVSFSLVVKFSFGNCERSHDITIGWNEDDGLGLEYGEDGDLEPITHRSVITSMYFDLALCDLEDRYIP